MTVEMAAAAGRALVALLKDQNKQEKINLVVGKDTRLSGDMLESAVCAGACAMGADVYRAGIFPTPGVAWLTTADGFDAGIVISASHNPYQDNGIKIFDSRGHKLSQPQEAALEGLIFEQISEFFD